MTDAAMAALSLLAGGILGFLLGRCTAKTEKKRIDFKNAFKYLDNYILCVSAVMVMLSILLSTLGKLETFASVTINVFGSVVFSWLLTKKSAKLEFKEHEQDLALRAYRHINYLETAADSAYKAIQSFAEREEVSKEEKLMLDNAMSQIKYIQGGINTCKMDWVDMLSPEQQQKCRDESEDVNLSKEYGTVRIKMPEEEYNQEEA